MNKAKVNEFRWHYLVRAVTLFTPLECATHTVAIDPSSAGDSAGADVIVLTVLNPPRGKLAVGKHAFCHTPSSLECLPRPDNTCAQSASLHPREFRVLPGSHE